MPIDSSFACPISTGSVVGVCPRAIVAPTAPAIPVLFLCVHGPQTLLGAGRRAAPSLCGKGFHALDSLDIVIQGAYGSTMWRQVADRSGRFTSILPSPLCSLTPGEVLAVDRHRASSNVLSLTGSGCS
jgi:alkanesulfonate monooxygenase SsuD/methylene tetrahydromethanopterin reductase-like flavin-dependent oxidoreductase (luciferase family)